LRDTSFLTQNLIAHRGYHDIKIGIPENSMLAFKRAIENNLIIELDVHVLKDGTVVVFHDDNLKRMTAIDKDIKNLDYQEIEKLQLQATEQRIPLLKEVLELVDGKVPLIIELKYDVKCGVLEEKVIEILKGYKGKYAIKSFNPLSVRYFKKKMPEAIRGQLTSNFKTRKILYNFLAKPDFVSCDIHSLPNRKAEKIRKRITLLGWTIKSKEDLEHARKYCDNYICENIDLDNRG
jgi:glycerophosphoryl diester phosphodiesterase